MRASLGLLATAACVLFSACVARVSASPGKATTGIDGGEPPKPPPVVPSRARSVLCRAKLVELDRQHLWHAGSDQARPRGLVRYPAALFEIVTPKQYAGRSFRVIYTCGTDKGYSPPLAHGRGHIYELRLPADFLAGTSESIEDCAFADLSRPNPLAR